MANGIAIKDVTNKLQGLNGEEVIPISTGANEPEVVEVDTLKEYINEDIVTSVNGNIGAVTINVPTKVSDLTNDSGFITSETEPDFNGSVAATITSADITAWNGKSSFSGSYNDLTDKPTLFSGAYADLTGKPNLAAVATSGDYDDLSNKPTIPSAVTESTVSGWGFTKNAGNVGSTTVSSIVTLTEAQYEALSTKDSSTLYIITSS